MEARSKDLGDGWLEVEFTPSPGEVIYGPIEVFLEAMEEYPGQWAEDAAQLQFPVLSADLADVDYEHKGPLFKDGPFAA